MCQPAPRGLVAAVSALLLAGCALAAGFAWPSRAAACGCFSPPVPPPMPGAVDFAVNQQAEQIIFEVEPDGHIVAHVLIRYAGDPDQFAWLVPVPSVPELELSHAQAFGMLEEQTAPSVRVSPRNLCPQPLYVCKQHPMPVCERGSVPGTINNDFGASAAGGTGGGFASPQVPTAPAVTVYAREQVGSYDTIVFGAGDAAGAVAWLQGEGFIVNDTTSPYMQPYLDENMLFVAAKLVPGADADAIRPLRMRYEGTEPMVPLQLTAVAAEPNLTVTTYIYGATGYVPRDQRLLGSADIPEGALASSAPDAAARTNYPMVLARLIDEEGGRAFMLEYSNTPPRFLPVPIPQQQFTFSGDTSPDCCSSAQLGADSCRVIGDGQCQCPLDEADAEDCALEPELVAGVSLIEELAQKYPRMTRITTRISAEEMSFDPMFEADASLPLQGRMVLTAPIASLAACDAAVLEPERMEEITALTECATTYCGRGRCVATASGVGCACDPGQVARTYTDLDGELSVTCVPDEAPVDLGAGGVFIPDVCATLAGVQQQSCVNLAGFAGMRCAEGAAAVLNGSGVAPICAAITHDSGTSGARDFTAPLEEVRVCAPPPPPCNATLGWLEPSPAQQRASVVRCETSVADATWLQVPPLPTCETVERMLQPAAADGAGGSTGGASLLEPADTTEPRPGMQADSGCRAGGAGGGLAGLPALIALGLLARRRRRR